MTKRLPLSSPTGSVAGGAAALAWIALAHLPVITFGFVDWDDAVHFIQNPLVLHPREHSLREHLLTPALGYPTPLTVLTYRIEYLVAGISTPGLSHVTNLALHVTACALLFAFGRALRLSARACAFGTLVFGIHPAVAESVAWVSGRKDLLALTFVLASLRAVTPLHAATARRRALAFGLFALALLCKPVAAYVTLIVPVLYDITGRPAEAPPPRRERLHAAARVTLPYAFLSAVIVGIAMWGQQRVGALHAEQHVTSYLRDTWYALGHHLGLVLLLQEPTAKYFPTPWPPPLSLRVDALPIAFAVGCAVVLRWLDAPRRRAGAVALFFAGASYLPNSNLVPLTRFLADTYVYAPMAGLGLFAGIAVDRLLDRAEHVSPVRSVAAFAVTGLLLTAMLLPAEHRYHDSLALWSHAYARYPHEWRLCRNAANAHAQPEGPAGLLRATDACIARFGPANFEKNRAIALVRLGRFEEARGWIERARVRSPDDPGVQELLRALSLQPSRRR